MFLKIRKKDGIFQCLRFKLSPCVVVFPQRRVRVMRWEWLRRAGNVTQHFPSFVFLWLLPDPSWGMNK